MDSLLDLHGFITVVLRLAELAARTLLLGSVVFWAVLLPPLRPGLPAAEAAALGETCRRLVLWAALAGAVTTLLGSGLGLAVLATTLEVPVAALLGAGFLRMAALSALAMLGLGALALPRGGGPGAGRRLALLLGALALLGAASSGSHAMARTEDRAALLAATALHQAGAAIWLGGLPALLVALRLGPVTAWSVGRRYSRFAAAGVGLILLGALGFWQGYIGGVEALYGTAYGALAATKMVMLGLMLLLGLGNFLLLHGLPGRFGPLRQTPVRPSGGLAAARAGLPCIRRFTEGEVAIGLAMLAAAASLTALPPASDLREGRIAWAQVVERFTPAWPRLASPDHADLTRVAPQAGPDAERRQRQAEHPPHAPGAALAAPHGAAVAWSEFNHHWAGIMVLLAGLAALLDATGRVPLARHWPLVFLGLAGFILVRSEPGAWPLAGISLPESLRDPVVVRHKLAGLLVAGFALSEWAVRLGWLRGRFRYVFPLAMLGGGLLLLTHTHASSDLDDALLMELSRLPLAVLALVGGIARWTELRGPAELAQLARWIWPTALVLTGLMLILHREA